MTQHLYPNDGDLYQRCFERACQLFRVGEPHPRFGRPVTILDQRSLAARIYHEKRGTWGGNKPDEK